MRLRATHRRPRRVPTTRAGPGRRTSRLQRLGIAWGARAFFVALGLTASLFVWQVGWLQHAAGSLVDVSIRFAGRVGLRVDDVLVEGRQRTDSQQILNALGVDRAMPILALDLDAARDRVQQLDWVKTATVARRLPDTIFVQVTEYRPIAVWQSEGIFALIDQAGAVIPANGSDLMHELPLVVGSDAAANAAGLLDILTAVPDVADRMKAAVRVSGRRWDLHLEGGIQVRLPELQIASALGRLADLNNRHALFDRDVKTVDLRLPDRLILQTNTEARPPAGQGEDT